MRKENTLPPIEMLDKVLIWFSMDVSEMSLGALIPRSAASKDVALKNIVEIFPELNSPEFLIYSDLILGKLVRDKYLIVLNPQTPIAPLYSITFDGKYFSENGGYGEQIKSAEIRLRWEDSLLEKGEKNGERLNKLTLVLGIGTIGLVLIELIKFVYELSRQSHN